MPEPRVSNWASTERVPAQILLAEQMVIQGELHLQPMVAFHEGSETPLEMLNRSDAFFPISLPGGEITFVAKAQVAVVTCAADAFVTDPERLGAAKTIGMEVVLEGGAELKGRSLLELPPTRSRALDYLNSIGQFFVLRSDTALRFINRAHVRVVRPTD